jgi:hypothetical protein
MMHFEISNMIEHHHLNQLKYLAVHQMSGGAGVLWHTFMLYTKQNELVVSIRTFIVPHYATYSWNIDDKASLRGGHGGKCELDVTENGLETPLAIGCLGQKRSILTLA